LLLLVSYVSQITLSPLVHRLAVTTKIEEDLPFVSTASIDAKLY
jgi:hypothetical protein